VSNEKALHECSALIVVAGDGLFGFDFVVPGVGLLEGVVDVADIFDAGGVEPVFEGFGALLGEDGDAVFPGSAAAEDAVEGGAGLDG
jgi:hypothetical protein